jgi:dinuclear metal center YbgI/SA1388 family protein
MNTIKLLRNLSIYFPKSIAEKGDYVGLMTGKLKKDTNKILLCLDFDEQVLPIAIKEKPDLILTHHPFIYGTRYRVMKASVEKSSLINKIDELDIPVYSMHTNFDTGKNGMNDALAEALNLTNIVPLLGCKMARGGQLEHEMNIIDFAKYATKALHVNNAWLINSGKKSIKSVAIIGGGGWYEYPTAKDEGYDIFISGDIPHHGRRDIIAAKYNYLDMPHEIEKIFVPRMHSIIKSIDKNIEIIDVDHEKEPILI